MTRLRHRDRLLSLKYSTIEACFSVPMLNLTLPNFPFVVAFAVKALGWQAGDVGLLAALPHLCNCLQPVLLTLVSRRLSSYEVLVLTFSLGALPWGLAGFLPWLERRDAAFAGMVLVSTLANSVSSVVWSSAIAQLVPERISGKYFGRRNLIFGTWTLIAVLVAGHAVDRGSNVLTAFCWIFAVAALSRMVGLLFLTRMKFPEAVMERRSRGAAPSVLLAVLRDGNYMRLAVFVGLWGLLLNSAMPFYTVYLVERLQLGVGGVVRLTTLASLGGLLTLRAWGRLCDRFGNRPVMQVCVMIWALTALVMWSLAGPKWHWHLHAGYLVVGAMTAGFQLCQFNLMVKLAPAQSRSAYVAIFLAVTSLLAAAGPILGGRVLLWLPERAGEFLGQPLLNFHVLFILAAVSGLGCSHLIGRVHEPAEQPVHDVWREMKTMRSFNPMLSVLAVGELLLTPRGILSLTRRSWRLVRRQVKAIEDVGEEIVDGSRDAIRKTFES
jgi:MFS family permease